MPVASSLIGPIQPKVSLTMRSSAATVDMSPTIRLRITEIATPESMSAYAALPFEPIHPKVDPGRGSATPSGAGLYPSADVVGNPIT